MADFERDIALLAEYKQWTVANKSLPDTSPTAFMVHKAQQEAFEKLEKLEVWLNTHCGGMQQVAIDEFMGIMEGAF